jgi:hypothetical protein
VLQQVNPMFPPEVNEDIEAVTEHLAARGLLRRAWCVPRTAACACPTLPAPGAC